MILGLYSHPGDGRKQAEVLPRGGSGSSQANTDRGDDTCCLLKTDAYLSIWRQQRIPLLLMAGYYPRALLEPMGLRGCDQPAYDQGGGKTGLYRAYSPPLMSVINRE